MFQIQAIGNLGKDAEVKQKDGREFMVFSVAAKVGKDKTQWLDCVMNGSKLAQYLTKGTKVFIQGSGSIETYQGNSGEKTTVKVSVNSLQLLGEKPSGNEAQTSEQNFNQQQARTYAAPTEGDDLPF